MYMGTKNIAIMNDVYEMLVASKTKDESFSDQIRRLMKSKRNIMEFAGTWKNITEKEAENMKKVVINMRKKSRLEDIKGRF